MRLLVVAVAIVAAGVLGSACMPASKSWVTQYVNEQVGASYRSTQQQIEALRDTISSLRDSLHMLNGRLEKTGYRLSAIDSVSTRLNLLEVKVDSLEKYVAQLPQTPSYGDIAALLALKQVVDEYVTRVVDSLRAVRPMPDSADTIPAADDSTFVQPSEQ